MDAWGRVLTGDGARWVVDSGGGELVVLDGPPWEFAPRAGARALAAEGARWLAPVEPSKVVAYGRTYAEHAREQGAEPPRQPLLFLKAPSAVVGPGEPVLLPPESTRVEFEGELALVLGRRVRRFRADVHALADVVAGFLAADDVTARDLQRAEGQWARAKSFDTFCPVARVAHVARPPAGARLRTWVSGRCRQDAALRDMSFSLEELIEHASAAMTLEPGDLLLSGTPPGVGPLEPGGIVRIEIDGLEPLEHGVDTEPAAVA